MRIAPPAVNHRSVAASFKFKTVQCNVNQLQKANSKLTVSNMLKPNNTSRWVFTALLRPQFRTPPVPNARSSECPRASIVARRRAAGSITISRPASCCCSNAIAGIDIGANFKMYLLRHFCANRAEFSFTIHRRHRRKK